MKNLTVRVIAFIVLTLNISAMANDITIVIFDTNILQEQNGFNLEQEAIVGVVDSEFKGNVSILIQDSNIIQVQNGNGSAQTLRIGTVGCRC